jgi:Flp pilus assembly pilin Flp
MKWLKVNRMKKILMHIWQDEIGAETAEWIIIAALITTVAAAVYPGVLQPALEGAVAYIEGVVTGVGAA